ncbi:LOW QUALITY PROTEIN: hypothetical protein HID58_062906 [Brassica napus]|uniref:Uncharacterized protein n=1 Tax=Brassica napus TaxID=3708 RepID=A0ABQ8A404_BRANA|nr:LOW QUALITY PROTEIN: hypothetical protein HID58_062906 [Brassica napus]
MRRRWAYSFTRRINREDGLHLRSPQTEDNVKVYLSPIPCNILYQTDMAYRPSAVTNECFRSQQSMEERMAVLVIRVGEVNGLVLKSPLYWESIEFLAKDEVSRGIFYALPDRCKLHYLKRKIKASNMEERELSYEPLYDY